MTENEILRKYPRTAFGGMELLVEGNFQCALEVFKEIEATYSGYALFLQLKTRESRYFCKCCRTEPTAHLLLEGHEENDSILRRLSESSIEEELIDYQLVMELRDENTP